MPTYDEVVMDGQRAVSFAIIAIAIAALLMYALVGYHPEVDEGYERPPTTTEVSRGQ